MFSPFELDCKLHESSSSDAPNISVVDWESLDHSVWATCKALSLLPPEVITASMAIPFVKEQQISESGSIFCGKHCETKSTADTDNGRHII